MMCHESSIYFSFILNVKCVLLFTENHSAESLIPMHNFKSFEFKIALQTPVILKNLYV